ncbi:hypothetical protein [Hoeflea olei]|uniref:Uncharacterized protein n=1 Tax=Hoeflea olei TaxID=1480615 RepID=A0A1C1YY66_9HYPH|nr:hypothetical protein [Hoeflea olei]OCW58493.1 hypothetical protein AWJ14_18540 [Hoeflea olei]
MSMTAQHKERQAARGQSRSDRVEYWVLVGIAFVVCLAMAGTSRGFKALRGKPVDSHGQSVFAEARASAHATAGYVFIA